jgi:nucleoside-diphosphate-sugar epimerase
LIESKSALVTGIDGFTGPYIKQCLEALGYRVYGITNNFHNNAIDTLTANLLNRDEIVKAVKFVNPEVVIHLAAVSFVADDDIDNMYAINIVGTRNLLQALAEQQCLPRSIVLASSATIYGSSRTTFLDEDNELTPSNDYGVSKLAMEKMASLWSFKLPITIVRPFNYSGVGQSVRFLIPKIVSHFVRKTRTIELGNIDVYRDFSDVRMVANAYAALADRGCSGETFNICSGIVHSLQEILDLMTEISGHSLDVEINPAFVRSNEILRLGGSKGKLDQHVTNLTNYSLKETLEWMYESAQKS